MIQIISLNPAMDRTLYVNEFSIGQVHRSFQYSVLPGGKGLNVARFIKEVNDGIPIDVIGFAGGETGRYLVDDCKKFGIKESFVKIKEETRVCVIIVDKEHSTVINENGPTVNEYEITAFKNTVDNNTELAVICGSVPNGVPVNLYAELVKSYKRNSAKVFIDANGKQLENAVIEGPDLIKVNVEEFAQLFHSSQLLSLDDQILRAHELFTYGIQTVMITNGAHGSLVITKNKSVLLTPPKVKAVNTTGCGDAFFAGLVIGYQEGLDEVESAIYGTAISAIKAENFAPVIDHPGKITDYQKQVITKYL